MRRSKLLLTTLLLGVIALAAMGQPAQGEASIEAFWQKFKTAVISGNKQAAAALTSFPLELSYGMPRIKNRAAFLRRYKEVFSDQADAVKCFETKKPVRDKARPREFHVACPNEAGDEVVIYYFKWTRAGWKFDNLDNINE